MSDDIVSREHREAQVAELEAEIAKLQMERDLWESRTRTGAKIIDDLVDSLVSFRAFTQYVVDMDPGNPAPLFTKARELLGERNTNPFAWS